MANLNHSFKERIPSFDKYCITTYNDIERCPYTWKDPEYRDWEFKDARRLFLIWLDKYADALQSKYIFKNGDRVSMTWENNIIYGTVTVPKKYESKVMWDVDFLDYWYYPNWELTKVEGH